MLDVSQISRVSSPSVQRLLFERGNTADSGYQPHVEDRADDTQVLVAGHARRCCDVESEPEENLAEVVRMSGVFPQTG